MFKDVTKKIVVIGLALALVLVIFIPSANSQLSTTLSISLLQKKDIKNDSQKFGKNLDRNSEYDNKLKKEEETKIVPAETQDWWDDRWMYRKNITIDHTKVDNDITNFPVCIGLPFDDDLASKAQDNGNDIVFIDDSKNKLNHAIELFNGSTGELVAWVNATSLSSTVNTMLHMYYGNQSVPSQENPLGVWDSSYKMVQHLNETIGTHYDSTSNGNDGTPQNGVNQDAVGKLDGADEFDAVDDHVVVSNSGSLDLFTLTIESWFNLYILEPGSGWQGIVSKKTTAWTITTDPLNYWPPRLRMHIGNEYIPSGTVAEITFNEWHHAALVIDGSTARLYLDGQNVVTDTSVSVGSTDSDLCIGRNQWSANDLFKGIIDEVRISNIARDTSWITTSYNNQNNPNTFYIIGEEESAPSGDVIPPTTTHQLTPATPDGENGWYVNDVTITFDAIDTKSGVAWTKYSINNGATWTTHTGSWPFDVIVSEGVHQLLYYSVDNAGNEEPVNGPFAFAVDKTIPEKRFFSFDAVFGPVFIAIVNIGLVRDGSSGLNRVEFYLNDEFHHQMDLSGWPLGRWCLTYWIYFQPVLGDNCTGIVYDMAGNWEPL